MPPPRKHIVPNSPEEVPKDAPALFREAADYYRTPRAQHPNSQNGMLIRSMDKIAGYSSYDRVDMISPHPLLMIAGTEADTRYFSEMAINKANDPKELFLIKGATHIDMYDRTSMCPLQLKRSVAFLVSICSLQENHKRRKRKAIKATNQIF